MNALDGEIPLTHVDVVAAREDGEIDTIVRDHRHARGAAEGPGCAKESEQLARLDFLGANLKRRRTRHEDGLGEGKRVEVAGDETRYVHDRVQTARDDRSAARVVAVEQRRS